MSATSEDDIILTQETDPLAEVSNNASENYFYTGNNSFMLETCLPMQPLELQSRVGDKDVCTIPKIRPAKDLSIEMDNEYNYKGVGEDYLAIKYNPDKLSVKKKQPPNCTFPKKHSARDVPMEIKRQIYKEYNEGVSPEVLVRKYDTSPTIINYIGNYCTALILPETKILICNDYKTGATVEELAKKYEFKRTMINYLLIHRRVKIRERSQNKSRKKYIRKSTNFSKQNLLRPAVTEYANWMLKMSNYELCHNKIIPPTCINIAPMANDVSKAETEIKKELEDLDEKDEFEKVIHRRGMLEKSDITTDISLKSNRMDSLDVIVKTEPIQPLELQSRVGDKDVCTIPKIRPAKDLSIEMDNEYNYKGVGEDYLAIKYNPDKLSVKKKQPPNCTFPKKHSARDVPMEIKRQIYKEYNEGVSPEVLVRKYDTSPTIIHYIGNYCTALILPETKILICNDYKTGATVEELAKKYKFKWTMINYLLIHRRVKIRERSQNKSRKKYIRKSTNFSKQNLLRPAVTEYANWMLKMSNYELCHNKIIPPTCINIAPMANDVSKAETEIKKELKNLDEEDEFEKVIHRRGMLEKSDITTDISLTSNGMDSHDVIVKTEPEFDSQCHSFNEKICPEFEKEKNVNGNIIKNELVEACKL